MYESRFKYPSGSGPRGSLTQSDVISMFRGFWERQAMWIREYITNLVYNTSNTVYPGQRLVENAMDFADVLVKYYGYDKAR